MIATHTNRTMYSDRFMVGPKRSPRSGGPPMANAYRASVTAFTRPPGSGRSRTGTFAAASYSIFSESAEGVSPVRDDSSSAGLRSRSLAFTGTLKRVPVDLSGELIAHTESVTVGPRSVAVFSDPRE